MKFKRYSKGTWRGETTEFDYDCLRNGGRYTGDFLVFEDSREGLGAVLFSVTRGKISGQCMKCYWDFQDRHEVPNEF